MVTSAIASFITIAFGIGGGALLLAVMASLLPPVALIPVHGVAQFGSNAGRMFQMARHVQWRACGMFTLGSLAGVALAGRFVMTLSAGVVQLGVGLFILWTVAARPPAWLARVPGLTGLISSLLTMFFGATGLFVATYTKSLKLGRHSHVATHGTLMSVQHALKSLTFAVLGFAFAPWIGLILAMIAAGAIGTAVGGLVLNRLSDRRFRIALDTILVLIALRLVWSGFQKL